VGRDRVGGTPRGTARFIGDSGFDAEGRQVVRVITSSAANRPLARATVPGGHDSWQVHHLEPDGPGRSPATMFSGEPGLLIAGDRTAVLASRPARSPADRVDRR